MNILHNSPPSPLPIASKLHVRALRRQTSCWSPQVKQFSCWPSLCALVQISTETIDMSARAVRHSGGCRWRGSSNLGVGRPCILYYSDVYIFHMVAKVPCFIDSNHISAVEDNPCVTTPKRPLQPWSVGGIPKGSVLGQILFIMYTPDLMRIIERHGLLPHLFGDDTQVYGQCSLSGMDDL